MFQSHLIGIKKTIFRHFELKKKKNNLSHPRRKYFFEIMTFSILMCRGTKTHVSFEMIKKNYQTIVCYGFIYRKKLMENKTKKKK